MSSWKSHCLTGTILTLSCPYSLLRALMCLFLIPNSSLNPSASPSTWTQSGPPLGHKSQPVTHSRVAAPRPPLRLFCVEWHSQPTCQWGQNTAANPSSPPRQLLSLSSNIQMAFHLNLGLQYLSLYAWSQASSSMALHVEESREPHFLSACFSFLNLFLTP